MITALLRHFVLASVFATLFLGQTVCAGTVTFFNSQQVATPVASGVTSDTISSNGYLFTYTRDKLFTGGLGGGPIGRPVRVPWPTGVEAQAVTTPPPGVTDYKARITLSRVDGAVFDIPTFTAKLLANTAATGASFEVMPVLNGEDAFNDPVYFDATGYYGSVFTYTEAGGYYGSTTILKGYDTYKIGLFVDFALIGLTLQDASLGTPGDFNADGHVDGQDFLTWQQDPGVGALGDWQSSYPIPLVVNSTTVPEPSGVAMLIALVGGVFLKSSRVRIGWRTRLPG